MTENDMTLSVGVDVNAGNVADQLDELAEEYADAAESLREEGEEECSEKENLSTIELFKEEMEFYEDQTEYDSVTNDGVDFVIINPSNEGALCFSRMEMDSLHNSKWTIHSISDGKLWCVRDDSPSIEDEVREVIDELRDHHFHTAEGTAERLEEIVGDDSE